MLIVSQLFLTLFQSETAADMDHTHTINFALLEAPLLDHEA